MDQKEIKTAVGKDFPDIVIPLINAAKKSIDIIVFDWKWYPDQIGSAIQKFNNAIVAAYHKGKQIRVITNSRQAQLQLQELDIPIKILSTSKIIHSKLMIIDGEIAVLGSHNYTMNAFTINFEVSVVIKDPETLERFNEYFSNLWSL